ncbi:hypothetical protein BZM27_52955 [Paraburkholderia steynii]|uniref:Nickel/cobalt efflux system n=1 Tax=Paraburkholderia steynii TaxID=1245441 RepID=A0A4R0X5Z8_9BURK|nr:hypothetical protein BZM27_52955 [Paraburkholderia steynii]
MLALTWLAVPVHCEGKLDGIYSLLALFMFGVWVWAYLALRGHPLLFGTAILAYSFGLRHASTADHIAAIDNVTRKLMQEGKRPVTVGFFFALGHSAVVVLVAFGVAITASALQQRVEGWKAVGGVISTSVSALFLFLVSAMTSSFLGAYGKLSVVFVEVSRTAKMTLTFYFRAEDYCRAVRPDVQDGFLG